MASQNIRDYVVQIAPAGGFISGETDDGRPFDFPRLRFDTAAAIAAVLNGPDPEYDHDTRVFSCGRRIVHNRPLAANFTPINDTNIQGYAIQD